MVEATAATATRKKQGKGRTYWKNLIMDKDKGLNAAQRKGWEEKFGKAVHHWTKEQYRLSANYMDGYLATHIDWAEMKSVLNTTGGAAMSPAEEIESAGGVVASIDLNRTVPPIVRKVLRQDNIPSKKDVKKLIEAAVEGSRPNFIKVQLVSADDIIERKIEGRPHKMFERAIRYASFVDPDNNLRANVMFVGPTGSGKSVLAEMVADALNMRYSHISLSAGKTEATLIGRFIPTGKGGKFEFSTTEFLDFYSSGGVYCLEEIDSADPNVLLSVNNALANGFLCTNDPDRPVVKRHPDFVCFSCANTWGTGANRIYVGRNQLDEATIDRFRMTRIEISYDVDLEKDLGDKTVCRWMQELRRKVDEKRLRKVVSTRAILQSSKMLAQGKISLSEIRENMFMGWTEEDLRKVEETTVPAYFKQGKVG